MTGIRYKLAGARRAVVAKGAVFFKWLYAAIASLGLPGLTMISYRQFAEISSCPSFGIVPACYVLLICYGAIFLSAFLPDARRAGLFWPGWIVVFVAAALGSSLEFAGHVTCPRSAGGTPTCYFSLVMAVSILASYLTASWIAVRSATNSNMSDDANV